MKHGGSTVAARQGGGTRQGFGHFNEEHLEREASATAARQKQLTQQSAASGQHKPAASDHSPAEHATPPPPREVSTVGDELGNRFVTDIVKGVKAIFDLHAIVGIRPGDTPEKQEHKNKVHEGYKGLTADQQAVAQEIYKKKLQTQQDEESARQQKEQQAKAAKSESIALPSSPKKGADISGGSRKKRATTQLQHNRQTLSNAAGAG